jgi:hypothetical protein
MKSMTIAAVILLAATSTFAADVVKRGAPVSSAKPVALATVVASPGDYTKKAVVVEGVIEKSCSQRGCWMELTPAAGEKTIHMTFLDDKFFIPLTAKGMKARAEGVTKIERNEAGTADEVSFVATGVELTKP